MKLPKTIPEAVDFVRGYIKHEAVSNERVGLLLGAAGLLVLFSIFFGLWSLNTSKAQQLLTARANFARLQAEATGDAWPKRVESTQALKAQLAVRLWDAPTAGLAEAGFETWLRNHFSKYGGDPQQIQISRSTAIARDGQTSIPGLQRMTAKVVLPFDQSVLMQILADAAEAEKIILIDRLIVRAGVNSRTEMDVSTFIKTNESAPSGARPRP